MTPEVMERAFEPFFTTKGPGEGSGLGLAMVYGFAKQSGGHIEIDSTLDVGTTVRLYLPRTELPQAVGEAEAQRERAADESRIVLVVEDNAAVRQMTVARLQDLGHRVLEADGAAAAVDLLGSDATIDVLFTDVVMPGGMSGIDLARRALQMRPTIKVLFASGYASSFHTTGGVIGELLQKPYRDEDLQQALTRAFKAAANGAASVARQAASG
jgi:CheY-like chemotaxis protein